MGRKVKMKREKNKQVPQLPGFARAITPSHCIVKSMKGPQRIRLLFPRGKAETQSCEKCAQCENMHILRGWGRQTERTSKTEMVQNFVWLYEWKTKAHGEKWHTHGLKRVHFKEQRGKGTKRVRGTRLDELLEWRSLHFRITSWKKNY